MVNALIIRQEGESVENMLRRLKTRMQKEDTLSEYRRSLSFESKSSRRRAKSGRARARVAKFQVQVINGL